MVMVLMFISKFVPEKKHRRYLLRMCTCVGEMKGWHRILFIKVHFVSGVETYEVYGW